MGDVLRRVVNAARTRESADLLAFGVEIEDARQIPSEVPSLRSTLVLLCNLCLDLGVLVS